MQVYKGIEQGYQVSIRAITKTCASQSNFLHPLLSTMPRAKQAKAAEPKKRLASTKWISEEEVSPKKAKVLKDSDKDKDLVTKLKTKPGVLDKCVFCNKSGVRTMLEGAGSATNMRFVSIFGGQFDEMIFSQGSTWRPSTTSPRASSKILLLPPKKTLSLGSCCPTISWASSSSTNATFNPARRESWATRRWLPTSPPSTSCSRR